MLLFFIGMDFLSLILTILLLLFVGFLIFWLTKKLLRKFLKNTSDQRIKWFARISAFLLSPAIVIGLLAWFVYASIRNIPQQSEEERVKNHYQLMEDDLRKDLKTGMSKTEVTGLFGYNDTTQSVMVYDLSLQGAEEKYLLEITFDGKGLKDFRRKQ